MRTLAAFVFVFVVAPAVGMLIYDLRVIGPAEREVQKDFTPVIAALEKYQTEKGRYPDTLDALVPAYIKELPACPRIESRIELSTKDSYHPGGDGKGYWLGCFVGVMVYPQDAMYFSNTKSWGRLD
jgi:hypothetical protein